MCICGRLNCVKTVEWWSYNDRGQQTLHTPICIERERETEIDRDGMLLWQPYISSQIAQPVSTFVSSRYYIVSVTCMYSVSVRVHVSPKNLSFAPFRNYLLPFFHT